MRVALYTVNIGNYDRPIPVNPAFVQGIDCFMFSDNPDLKCEGWKVEQVDLSSFMGNYNPVRLQRGLKIRIPDILKDYDRTVYIDANVQLIRPIAPYLKLHKGEISVKVHPKRNCVYQEGFAVIEHKKADPSDVKAQLQHCIDLGIKPGSGMYETNVIIRDRSESVDNFCQVWYNELNNGTHRDQLAIIPAREATGIQINAIPYTAYQQHFKTHPHPEPVIIHYIQPYSTTKAFGQAINTAIENLNANSTDWICLMDYDAMFMSPNYGRQISEVLQNHGKQYQIFGAMTNRIRADHQKVKGLFDEFDMRVHANKAKDLETDYWGEVTPVPGVAGFCMIFQKRLWDKVKFNDSITFDTEFNNGAKKLGAKVAVMKGVYMLHCYRILSDDPLNETAHLK